MKTSSEQCMLKKVVSPYSSLVLTTAYHVSVNVLSV